MLDSEAMYMLEQLHEEVERNRAAIAALQDAFFTMKRIAGVFYDTAVKDMTQLHSQQERKDRHLKVLSAIVIACMAGTAGLRSYTDGRHLPAARRSHGSSSATSSVRNPGPRLEAGSTTTR